MISREEVVFQVATGVLDGSGGWRVRASPMPS